MQPKIIILCGIPGAGKSTWTDNHVSLNSWNTRVISRDTAREKLFGHPYIYSTKNENTVTDFCKNRLTYLVNGKYDIILDNTHCREKYIDEQLKNILENYSDYNVYIKFFDVPLWKCLWRAWRRGLKREDKKVPAKIILQMHKNFKKINKKKYAGRIL
jgi:predicted kinase